MNFRDLKKNNSMDSVELLVLTGNDSEENFENIIGSAKRSFGYRNLSFFR